MMDAVDGSDLSCGMIRRNDDSLATCGGVCSADNSYNDRGHYVNVDMVHSPTFTRPRQNWQPFLRERFTKAGLPTQCSRRCLEHRWLHFGPNQRDAIVRPAPFLRKREPARQQRNREYGNVGRGQWHGGLRKPVLQHDLRSARQYRAAR